MAGINEFTKLMLHLNGENDSTTFIDDSPSEHTITRSGQVHITTAQSVFGGASAYFDGSGDWLIASDSDDFHFSGDFTIDFRVRWDSTPGETGFMGQSQGGGSQPKWGLYWNVAGLSATNRLYWLAPNLANSVTATANWTPSADTWYHVAVTREGNNWRFFVDGTQIGDTVVNSHTIVNPEAQLRIGADGENFKTFKGFLDEIRFQNGEAVWTENFTPPTAEYSPDDDNVTFEATPIDITMEVQNPLLKIDTLIQPDNIDITLNGIAPDDIGNIVVVTPNVIDINMVLQDPVVSVDTTVIPDNIDIEVNPLSPVLPIQANFASKIISFNPLIFITDTTPAKVIKVDITNPEIPTYQTSVLTGVNNAKDVSIGVDDLYIYIAGDTGQVVKVLISDLDDQTIIDVSDSDDLLTIESNINFGITYAGTNNETGELYVIDERSTFEIDTDFHVLAPVEFEIDSSFYIVSTFKIDSDFNALSINTFTIDCDFKCVTAEVDNIDPIGLLDYQVFVDNVELEDTDLILDSISITHSIDEESRATFRLARKHDQINTTLSGNTIQITNQNEVEIRCNGKTIFPLNGVGTGRISRVAGVYQERDEYIDVEALSEEAPNKFDTITMSLPGLEERLSLFHVLMESPNIYNPWIDPDNEDTPKKYKGIRVNLGEKITQQVSRFLEFDSFGNIAKAINGTDENGDGEPDHTFNPLQNWTYFWSPTVRKIVKADLGDVQAIKFFYIGTSLGPVSESLWDLTRAEHKRQRIFEDKVEELGNYEVGEAPFRDTGVPRNGKLISKFRWVDEPNGLYSIKDQSYDFIDFAKEVADLEYEALKNINGDILPDTSCSLTMTIDAFLFYQINLLTRIKIDNTTEANIYKNQNGFPVSVKSINITSGDRKVHIEADNKKSSKELEILNDLFPDEEDPQYTENEQRILIDLKTDMNTRLAVE